MYRFAFQFACFFSPLLFCSSYFWFQFCFFLSSSSSSFQALNPSFSLSFYLHVRLSFSAVPAIRSHPKIFQKPESWSVLVATRLDILRFNLMHLCQRIFVFSNRFLIFLENSVLAPLDFVLLLELTKKISTKHFVIELKYKNQEFLPTRFTINRS